MIKFLLTDIFGRNIYATPFGIRTGFRVNEPVIDPVLYYHTFSTKGEKVTKTVEVSTLVSENRFSRRIVV